MPCGQGEVCAAGQCVLQCAGGTVPCGSACVNTQSDPAHCGGCNLPCAPGKVCSASQCTAACGQGLTNCNGACVNTTNDAAHCGDCNTVCPANQTCQSGDCQAGGGTVTIDTHNFNGMTEYPLDTDVCMCCGGTTSKETADAFCVLAGHTVAQSWTVGMIGGTNCYCWDCIAVNQWSNNCCSGFTTRPMILTVTCL